MAIGNYPPTTAGHGRPGRPSRASYLLAAYQDGYDAFVYGLPDEVYDGSANNEDPEIRTSFREGLRTAEAEFTLIAA